MSQRDLVAELRAAHVEAPPEVRERVRLIAADAPAPPRRVTWRRALVVAVPLAAAVAATVVFTRPSHDGRTAFPSITGTLEIGPSVVTPTTDSGSATRALTVPAAKSRVQRYSATLGLRVEKPKQVSDAVKAALRITSSLGGYSARVRAESHDDYGVADLTLRIPRDHVQEAVRRLSQLGTITSENVSTVDLQAQLNAADRRIAQLQKQIATLRPEPATAYSTRRIAALTKQIQRLQREQAATRRTAHYATVGLHLETPLVVTQKKHGHGPLHGLGVAFKWIGIGAVYALAIGAPLLVLLALIWLAVRVVRRRRVDALLSRS
jgi:hypothetical protein